jgi:hypothetical protein
MRAVSIVRVLVDSRVRVFRADLSMEYFDALRALFEHKNPQHEKMRHLGIRFDHRKESRLIKTWRDEGAWLSLPRGGMSRVRALLVSSGAELRVKDARSDGAYVPASSFQWPELRRTLFEDQAEALERVVARQTCYLRAPTGCLVGDTIVTINRAGKGAKMRLDHVVYAFNGGLCAGRRWRSDITTFVRAPFEDGTVHLARVLAARSSGVRDVYRAKFAGGCVLTLTCDHRLLTSHGWMRLDALSVGAAVLFDGVMGTRGRKSMLAPRQLVSVEYAGRQATYDLEVERAAAFIANGVAVHNSGKTEICLALIARVRKPTIVVVWTGALFSQWMERIRDGLGVKRAFVGQIRGGKKTVGAITVAMQQALARFPAGDPVFDAFGVVIADELQRFSAPTFIASIDPFAARYRVGVSADERRADRKEFLAYDLFGDLALSINRKELVARKRVRDVEIRVIPTGWKSPVDSMVGSSGDQYREMLDAMAQADGRDEHVLRVVEQERARGEQILVFSLRVEHCRRLVGKLARGGIAAGLMVGGAEHKAALDQAVEGLLGGSLRVAVGTVQAVGTGVDLPRVGVGIAAMPVASNRQLFGQVAGRICRIAGGEGPARLYYLLDACRAKDWPALFDDGRPVFVQGEDGEWIDARKERRRAKSVAVPSAASCSSYQGETRWLIR